ncbi:MAG: HAMP domain-containing protein, partial [Desulfuromonadaceae bacterium]
MQIKKKLQINVAVSAVTALLICLMFLMTMLRISQAMEVAVIADKIIIKIFERGALRDDYLRTGSERAKTQWFDRQEQIGELLKSAAEKFKDTERRKKIVAELSRNHDTAGKLFSAIVKNREKIGSVADSSVFFHEVESILLTQLNLRQYDDTLQAGKLQEVGYELMFTSLRKSGGGIAGVLAIVIAASLVSSWTMSRAITKRVRGLRDGSAMIGGGDLDHRIDMEGDDEFAEISGAFNAMAAKLRGTYHDLGKEIEEHRHTEEALRQKEERLRLAMAAARMASWDWNVSSGDVV